MKKSAFVIIFLACSLMTSAQWRIGITGGATYNQYTIDNHYMSDWHYRGAWGKTPMIKTEDKFSCLYVSTLGLIGQYDFCDWFGVRADLNLLMKNHRQYRTMIPTDYETLNMYIQLPLMASFSFGGKKLRGFLNAGIYGGYWLNSWNNGHQYTLTQERRLVTHKNEFAEERDQRYDYGLAGGVGLEWRFTMFKKDWAWQLIEARIYYSTQSTQKDYMKIKDPRYNTTLALQSGLCYFF